MKRCISGIPLLLSVLLVCGQHTALDSLRQAFAKQQADSTHVFLLSEESYVLQDSKPDSSLLLAQTAYFIAKGSHFEKGEAMALNQMAAAYKSLGNFPKSLEYYIGQLKIEERIGSPIRITNVYMSIASLYANSGEFDNALSYAKKADVIINQNKLDSYAPYSLLNIGDIYEKQNLLDSAILYATKAYAFALTAGNPLIIGASLNNIGNINNKSGHYLEALDNYNAGMAYQVSSDDYATYAESLLGKAKIFSTTGPIDSAIFYAKKSFEIAAVNKFTVRALDASVFLSALYRKNNNIDSAYAYQQTMIGLKDSIYSQEKIKELQNISSAEHLRQGELEQLRQTELRDREIKLQYLIIGIIIPIFFLLSIFISRKKVHKRLIEFTGIVSVLLFFEYITLLLHPFIAEKSHHSPLIEIVIFVAIAAIITPTHHKIQHWLLNKLAEYNYLKHHKPVVPVAEENNTTEEDPQQA